MKETIKKTKEYLDYIEEHHANVQKAWGILCKKCTDMRFISDDLVFFTIDAEIKNHDISKLSKEEFIQYRISFYPTEKETELGNVERRVGFDEGWEHHKKHNSHHWETWTKTKEMHPYENEVDCVHMVCDWMAMGFKFKDTAKEYYEKNNEKIKLPEWAVKFIYEIFDRIN